MPASEGSGAPSVAQYWRRRARDRVPRTIRSAARRAAGGGAPDRLITGSSARACDTRCALCLGRTGLKVLGLWPICDVAWGLTEVRSSRQRGPDLLNLSSSRFDPERTW
jgi:hypothetical protein